MTFSVPTFDISSTRYLRVRKQTERICEPLETEDYVAQPIADVSPPRWHLAHTTWFFETFILEPHVKDYSLFNEEYPFLFNSYYVQAGERWQRDKRGALTRPTVKEMYAYRAFVDEQMTRFLDRTELTDELAYLIELGLQHEQQHQELLLYDIKYILGHNPLFPVYSKISTDIAIKSENTWSRVASGIYQIGHVGDSFCFDNEKGVHSVFLHDFELSDQLVSNAEYLEFIESGGYQNANYWLDEGWKWVVENDVLAPMYWQLENTTWKTYTFGGLRKVEWSEPVMHVSFYEADAFARWKKCRLPTEFEWEIACQQVDTINSPEGNFIESENFRPLVSAKGGYVGNLWEWTSSAYRPYPFFKIAEGALGEYNGKFMINQMVLKGGSFATSKTHIRPTYRNFFHPHLRWMFSGIRLARDI